MGLSKLAIWVSEPYGNDELFNAASSLNRDDCLVPFRALKRELILHNGECHTQDIYIKEKSTPDIVLFLDIPIKSLGKLLGGWDSKVRKWLVLQECKVVLPHNWDVKSHMQFDKIFTWNDELVDGVKYFKSNWTHLFPPFINYDITKKNKLCTLIAGNKAATHPLELYSKRIEAIRWFEKNHPDDFDLYGIGWDECHFKGPFPIKALNRFKTLKRVFAPHYPSYCGTVDKKREVLEKYKFSICYENARDIPGYITEKIFDCFFAGCVPVYWGAGNVTAHIPRGCFIDKREFDTYEQLYSYMKSMSDKEYLCYLENIDDFLKSKRSYQFSAGYFAETMTREMLNG